MSTLCKNAGTATRGVSEPVDEPGCIIKNTVKDLQCQNLSYGAFPLHGTARYGTVRFTFGGFSTGYCTWYLILF